VHGDDGVAHEVEDDAGVLGVQAAVDQALVRLGEGAGEELMRPGHAHDHSGQSRVLLEQIPHALGVSAYRVLPGGARVGEVHLSRHPFEAGGQEVLARGDRAVQPGDGHPEAPGHSGQGEVGYSEGQGGLDDVRARESRLRPGGIAQSCHGSTVMRGDGGCPLCSTKSKVALRQI